MKYPPIIATPYDPVVKKKRVKPLNCEMAYRQKRALQRMLDEGDIDQAEFDSLWQQILDRVKAGV